MTGSYERKKISAGDGRTAGGKTKLRSGEAGGEGRRRVRRGTRNAGSTGGINGSDGRSRRVRGGEGEGEAEKRKWFCREMGKLPVSEEQFCLVRFLRGSPNPFASDPSPPSFFLLARLATRDHPHCGCRMAAISRHYH